MIPAPSQREALPRPSGPARTPMWPLCCAYTRVWPVRRPAGSTSPKHPKFSDFSNPSATTLGRALPSLAWTACLPTPPRSAHQGREGFEEIGQSVHPQFRFLQGLLMAPGTRSKLRPRPGPRACPSSPHPLPRSLCSHPPPRPRAFAPAVPLPAALSPWPLRSSFRPSVKRPP